jgi:hypothetical protein
LRQLGQTSLGRFDSLLKFLFARAVADDQERLLESEEEDYLPYETAGHGAEEESEAAAAGAELPRAPDVMQIDAAVRAATADAAVAEDAAPAVPRAPRSAAGAVVTTAS